MRAQAGACNGSITAGDRAAANGAPRWLGRCRAQR